MLFLCYGLGNRGVVVEGDIFQRSACIYGTHNRTLNIIEKELIASNHQQWIVEQVFLARCYETEELLPIGRSVNVFHIRQHIVAAKMLQML